MALLKGPLSKVSPSKTVFLTASLGEWIKCVKSRGRSVLWVFHMTEWTLYTKEGSLGAENIIQCERRTARLYYVTDGDNVWAWCDLLPR